MDKDSKNFIQNSLSGLLVGVVVIYLDRNGLTAPSYVVFGLYLLFIIAVCIKEFMSRKKQADPVEHPPQKQPSNAEPNKIKQTQEEIMHKQIILYVLKLRGFNETASPKKIAALIEQDVGIIFAHMMKLHNDQYMTFQTGGASPTIETDFFLCGKASEITKGLV